MRTELYMVIGVNTAQYLNGYLSEHWSVDGYLSEDWSVSTELWIASEQRGAHM